MPIRVLSLDYDGCLSREQNPDIIETNKNLLERFKQEGKGYSEVVCFVGSNRQSLKIDRMNVLFKKNGSCFQEIQKISEYIDARFDNLLLADIHDNLESGVSFRKAEIDREIYETSKLLNIPYTSLLEHADWMFDTSKVSILYAQIHKVASENPDVKEIIFDFFDDRDDIVSWLGEYFKQCPQLIPANVKLRIFQYQGGDEKLISENQGTGVIDKRYRETVKKMEYATLKDYRLDQIDYEKEYLFNESISPKKINNPEKNPLKNPLEEALVPIKSDKVAIERASKELKNLKGQLAQKNEFVSARNKINDKLFDTYKDIVENQYNTVFIFNSSQFEFTHRHVKRRARLRDDMINIIYKMEAICKSSNAGEIINLLEVIISLSTENGEPKQPYFFHRKRDNYFQFYQDMKILSTNIKESLEKTFIVVKKEEETDCMSLA